MTPVRVAAARNINIAVEGESIMTDEDLKKAIQEVSEELDSLPKSDDSLSGEERKSKHVLLLKKETLDKIKVAREKNDKDQELHNIMVYGLLTSWGDKHPYLMSIVRSNLRWSSF